MCHGLLILSLCMGANAAFFMTMKGKQISNAFKGNPTEKPYLYLVKRQVLPNNTRSIVL